MPERDDERKRKSKKKGFRVLRYSFSTNIFLTLLKTAVALYTGSQAMLSDAIHSLSDIFSTAVNMVALKIAERPADANHHYGHERAETVAAKVVALLILAAGLGIGVSSLNHLRFRIFQEAHLLTLIMALISLIIKESMYRYAMKVSQDIGSKAIEADAKHHRSDALSSLVVVFGVTGAYLGYPWLDPVAGLLVALLIVKIGGELYWQSIQELVDRAPHEETIATILKACHHTEGVLRVNELKARMYGDRISVDLRLCVDGSIPLIEGHAIAHKTAENIKDYLGTSTRVLVHIDPCYEWGGECKDCPHIKEERFTL